MKIELTNVIDKNIVDDSFSFKLMLADNVVDLFTPLFCEELRKKQGQFKRNVSDIKKLKQDISNDKKIIEKSQLIIKKNKVRSEILNEIEYLSNVDVIYGNNREIIKNILLTLDKETLVNLSKNLFVLRKMVRNKVKK